jgi:RHS repeat-associated protein
MSYRKRVYLCLGMAAASLGCSAGRGAEHEQKESVGTSQRPLVTAPSLDRSIVTTTGAQTEFLYTDATPTQSGVAPGAIDLKRAAAVSGKVIDRDTGEPLADVTVKVLGMPEFGSTQTEADGSYRLVVNGTRRITLDFSAAGYFVGQRQVQANALQYASVAELALVEKPEVAFAARSIPMAAGADEFGATGAGRLYRGPKVTDANGTRQLAAYFPPQAEARTFNASRRAVSLSAATVSSVEYTTGPNGLKAMPAELPPATAYTYAAELTVAEGEGAVFNPPIPIYVDNFLDLPVGTNVPSGYYDRERGHWVAGNNGRVLEILSITADQADLDVDGSGMAANTTTLAGLGITEAERTQLAILYTEGQTIWRVPVGHFSLWDFNLGFVAPAGSRPGSPGDDASDPPGQCKTSAHSTIECESQVLTEELDVSGTPFQLQYRSDRVVGRTDSYTLKVPVTGASLPGPLQRIEVELTVGGRTFSQTLPAQANQFFDFTWDGKDAFGRLLQGVQPALMRVGNVYDAVYADSPRFGAPGGASTGVVTRVQAALWGSRSYGLGIWDAKGEGLGGWNLSVHHVYDPVGQVVQLGSGTPRASNRLAAVISAVAGNGMSGFSPDGTLAREAKLMGPYDVAVAPDGTLFIAEQTCVRRVLPNGALATHAGTCGVSGVTGDGGLATEATLHVTRMAIGPDGTMYLSDILNDRIRKIDSTTGIITLAVGTGVGGFGGDGGPATLAQIDAPLDVSVAVDGTLYFADSYNDRLRAVGTDGLIQTIAGNGAGSFPTGNDGPALSASLPSPLTVLALPDGSVLVSDPWQVRRVGVDGIIRPFAGNLTAFELGDGRLAVDAEVERASDMALGPDGSIYIADGGSYRIRRVDNRGYISTVAGKGTYGASGDGGPATAASLALGSFTGLAMTVEGTMYVAEYGPGRVRKIAGAFPGVGVSDVAIPSSDGREVYVFNSDGKHLRTEDTFVRTPRPLYKFDYSGNGHLAAVTDVDGNVTTIQRDGFGNLMGILAPSGQVTSLLLDAEGYIGTFTNASNEATSFTYDAGGLMQTKSDPRGFVTNFTYDAVGRLTKDADPAPDTGYLTYQRTDTATGWLVDETTKLNRVKSYLVEQLPNGDRKREITQPSGVKVSVVYSADGTQTVTMPDGTIVTQALSPDPRFGMLSPIVSTTRRTPSGLTRVESSSRTAVLSDPLDLLSLTSHTEQRVLNGRVYTNFFDASTRSFTTTSPSLRQAVATLNANAHLESSRVADFLPTQLAYDAQGRLTSSQEGTRLTTLAYDSSSGYLKTLTDALLQASEFVTDGNGRTTQVTYPDQSVLAIGLDPNGNVTSITPPGSAAHAFAYTPVNLLQSYTPPVVSSTGTLSTTYVYDADRGLSSTTTPDSLVAQRVYDAAGRLEAVALPTGNITYTYSPTTGKVSSIGGPYGETLSFGYDGELTTSNAWSGPIAGSVNWTYDSDFRVSGEQVNSLTSTPFGYDNDSLLTSVGSLVISRDPTNGLVVGTAISTVNDSYTYDMHGALATYAARVNTTELYGQSITARDALNRIENVTETVQGTATTFGYSYDSRGRLTDVIKDGTNVSHYDYDANGNRIAGPSSAVTATYDAQDRLLTSGGRTYSYGANGELNTKVETGQTTTYTYDVVGNLTAVVLPGPLAIQYIADGSGRRVGKARNGTLMQGFLYSDQLRIAAELDATNGVVSTFSYGTKGNAPDFMQKGGAAYRFFTDHLGSVRLVVNVSTGAVAQRIDYDEFGVVTADSNPGFQPFGFAGGLYDVDTQLVRFGARDYDPSVGRWVSKDPILFDGDGPNLYAYVLNDPVNRIDSNGEGFLDCGKAVAKYLECIGEGDRSLKNREDENACNPDAGHDKAIEQKRNRCEALRQKAFKACKDPSTWGPLLIVGAVGVGISLVTGTGEAAVGGLIVGAAL